MNIIIEGPDATGKTQLAELIQTKLKYPIEHIGDADDNYATKYLDLIEKDNTIYDRFHMSELVFPQIYGRTPKLSFADAMLINKRLVDNNDLFIILFSSDLGIINQRLMERGEVDNLAEVEAQYKKFLEEIYIFNGYFSEYSNYRVIDIADPDGYVKLYDWLDWKLS